MEHHTSSVDVTFSPCPGLSGMERMDKTANQTKEPEKHLVALMKINLMEHKEDLGSTKGTIRMKDTELRTTNVLSRPQACRDDGIVSSGQMRK